MNGSARGTARWRSLSVGVAALLAIAALATGVLARQPVRGGAERVDRASSHIAMHLDTTGCGGRGAGFPDTARGNAAVRDCLLRVTVRMRLAEEERRLNQATWSFPEAHDEQRFLLADGSYGPMAFIFASPQLGTFRHAWQIAEHRDRGMLAAVVFVDETDPRPLSGDYASLGLSKGINCVWLVHGMDSPEPRWRAKIGMASPGGTCVGSAGTRPLAVVRHTAPFVRDEDYPASARFTESQDGRPLLGMKCLTGWCDIGEPLADGVRPRFEVLAPQTASMFGGREAKISGWHDEQLLSTWQEGKLVRTDIRATIVPVSEVAERPGARYNGRWQHVATITLDRNPPAGSKYATWGLRRGQNGVWLMDDGGTWRLKIARRADDDGYIWSKPVIRTEHFDAAVPTMARFRFNSYDDGVWIPCGAACCYAEGDS